MDEHCAEREICNFKRLAAPSERRKALPIKVGFKQKVRLLPSLRTTLFLTIFLPVCGFSIKHSTAIKIIGAESDVVCTPAPRMQHFSILFFDHFLVRRLSIFRESLF